MNAVYVSGECDDYNYYMDTSEDDDEDHGNRMPQVETVSKDATVLGDEKQKSEVLGTRELIAHDGASAKKSSEKKMSEGDVEPMEDDKLASNKATNGNASEDYMSTEMEKKKKEKRKLKEDEVESDQNDGTETTTTEVTKKKKSTS
ncbi:hypothetical protein MKW94_030410 [Papaver nudicaule]|uniref:Uncharacterized protein n=1 Tax=Papaver nudicaule TaxID=74823 RepID=A0AA41RQR6_PAPNU|nr:hypothetical protein [Papaver nudicaule]